jgi:protein-S-isoprenylcysteine O-methyltransferase Ste14
MFWAYLAVMMVPSLGGALLLQKVSPGLVEERLHPGPGERDRFSLPLVFPTMAVQWVIAGADVGRFHWSGPVGLAVQIPALIVVVVGIGVALWAMIVNRFFSSAVRIQADRGQVVITSGPYRYVRHPGYTGGILFSLCNGPALGSWWAVLPMLLAVAGIIRRTILEDRMLQQELAGYAEYAQKVRYRLAPGVW